MEGIPQTKRDKVKIVLVTLNLYIYIYNIVCIYIYPLAKLDFFINIHQPYGVYLKPEQHPITKPLETWAKGGALIKPPCCQPMVERIISNIREEHIPNKTNQLNHGNLSLNKKKLLYFSTSHGPHIWGRLPQIMSFFCFSKFLCSASFSLQIQVKEPLLNVPMARHIYVPRAKENRNGNKSCGWTKKCRFYPKMVIFLGLTQGWKNDTCRFQTLKGNHKSTHEVWFVSHKSFTARSF